jgi:transketolase
MRAQFSKILHRQMGKDERIILLTGDLGYGLWDKIRIDYPTRFINFGSSEQLMLGAAAGLATDGLIPVAYSITPFILYRPFEFIRNYLDHEGAPVKLLGGGRDEDYGHLGFSHWAKDDRKIMGCFENIKGYWPESELELQKQTIEYLSSPGPGYMNLKR